MKPAVLPPNVLRHFYAGGPRIAALRGIDLPRDAIAAAPEDYLGPEHVARWGADPGLLVKLIDAGQRLPVHFHPGRAFAAEALGASHGKTEAWIIVDAEPGASVHAGFA